MGDLNRPVGDLVSIFHPPTQVEAQSFAFFLRQHGIAAVVNDNSAIQGTMSAFAGSAFAIAPQVLVSREDQEKAEALIVEFEQVTRHASEITTDPKDEYDDPHVAWRDWPRCPSCSCLRIAECPDCGEAGDDFSLSEYQEEEAPLEPTRKKPPKADDDDQEDEVEVEEAPPPRNRYPFVLCPQCGEAFRPVFYRRCAHCTHVFPDGKSPPPVERKKEFRWGPVLAFFGLIAAIVVIAIAFYIRTKFQP